MKNKPDFSAIKDEKLRKLFENIDFEKASDRFFEKLKIEKEEAEIYFKDGSFTSDIDKIKEYLKTNNHFCFEDNGYHKYIDFISEKYLIKNIESMIVRSEDDDENMYDEQEYEVEYENLRFNFLRGLGTIITVYKKKGKIKC